VSAGDQTGPGTVMVAAWRIRSAVLVVPSQKLLTVSEQPGMQRGTRGSGVSRAAAYLGSEDRLVALDGLEGGVEYPQPLASAVQAISFLAGTAACC
jgi:hypothetical protein